MNKSKSISKPKSKNLVLSDTEQNTILGTIYDGGLAIDVAKDLKISLRTFYRYLETNLKFKAEFNKAQEVGIKTLVEMCVEASQKDVVINYTGTLDGQYRKDGSNNSFLEFFPGFEFTSFFDGVRKTYEWYNENRIYNGN